MFLLITKCGGKQQKRKHILLKKTEPRLENFYETKQSLRISFCWPLYCKYMAARAVTKCRGAEHTPLLTRTQSKQTAFSITIKQSTSAKAHHALSTIIALVIAMSDCPPTSFKSYEYLGLMFYS